MNRQSTDTDVTSFGNRIKLERIRWGEFWRTISYRARHSPIISYFPYLIIVFAATGCAQPFLYNEARDRQGQAATKAASEVKLTETVTTIQKRFDSLLDLELDAAKTRFVQIRESEIKELAFKTAPIKDTWIERINTRLTAIGGMADWQKIDDLAKKEKIAQDHVAERRNGFIEAFMVVPPPCDRLIKQPGFPPSDFQGIKEEQRKEAESFLQRFIEPCTTFVDAQTELKAARKSESGGELTRVLLQLERDQTEKRENDELRQVVQAAMQSAIDAYNKEAQDIDKPEHKNTYSERLVAAAQKLLDTLKTLEEKQGALGVEVLAKERIKHIEEVLTAITRGEVDTSKWNGNLRKAIAVTGSIPALTDEATEMLHEAKRPRLVPLVIAREHQRQLVEEAARVDAVLERRIAASQKIVKLYRNEYDTLSYIFRTLKKSGQQSWQAQSLLKLDANLKLEQKRLLYELLGIYFGDIPQLQSDQRLWEYRRITTFYEETIERSKAGALMWQNLLDGVANTVAGYHSAGVKPEEIAQLLQALGVVAVGIGVNR